MFGIDRLERKIDNIDRKVDRLSEKHDEHISKENGHPAKIVWHSMTWPQLIGLGLVCIILVIVAGDEVSQGWLGNLFRGAGEVVEAAQAILPAVI